MILKIERQNFSDAAISPDLIKGIQLPAECPGSQIIPATFLSVRNTVWVLDVICHPDNNCTQTDCSLRRILALDAL